MATNKLQWKRIAKGEKLPCQSFLRKKNGEILKLSTIGGVTVGQDAYYLPVDDVIEEIKNYPIEESEDEKIRKHLITLFINDYGKNSNARFAGIKVKDIIAWLEKQGEQKSIKVPKFKVGDFIQFKGMGHTRYTVKEVCGLSHYINTCNKRMDMSYTDANFELVEQKPNDKIEPKFHEGDWVVISTTKGDRVVQIASVEYSKDGYPSYITTESRWFGNGTKARLLTDKDVETITLPESKVIVEVKVEPEFHEGDWIIHHGTENIYQVVAIIDNQYQLKYGDNYTVQKCADVDRCARLWNIAKDAKDGDVLELDCGIGIFKDKCIDGYNIHCYCYYSNQGVLEINKDSLYDTYQSHPATKEQRDQLERAITNAGYEWDAEKKELKKIEQKPAWSEEDEKGFNTAIQHIENYVNNTPSSQRPEIWADITKLKSLKDRVQPKQEWSEEDEDMLKSIIATCELAEQDRDSSPARHLLEMQADWLKSLKDRVQPQSKTTLREEDEEYINDLIGVFDGQQYQAHSDEEIADWLKSLKGRYIWRPSNEQISVLSRSLKYINTISPNYCHVLEELLAQLKKLKG